MFPTLQSLFPNVKENTLCEYLENGRVEAISVSTNKTTILCHVRFSSILSLNTLRGLEQAIEQSYHLHRMRILPKYQMNDLHEKYLQVVRAHLYEKNPSARGVFLNHSWKLQDDCILIKTHPCAKEYLQGLFHQIRNQILEETGLQYTIQPVFLKETTHSIGSVETEMVSQNSERDTQKHTSSNTANIPAIADKEFTKKSNSENVLFGKFHAEDVILMKDATDEHGRVTVQGEIFFTEHREIKSKKNGNEYIKVMFDMTDQTNSLRICKLIPKNQASEWVASLKTGLFVIVQGTISYDQWEKEMILTPSAILKSKKKIRQDTSPVKRVELHMHSNMSAMDGVTPVKKLIQRAVDWGHSAMAITDHGVAQAFPEAMHKIEDGKLENFKMIYGVEAYYVNDCESVTVVKGRHNCSFYDTFVCFDLETTGLNPKSDAITEIAATILRNGQEAETFHTYVNPERPIPAQITQLTGITDDMVKNAPSLSVAIEKFLTFADHHVLVAHNASFDMAFLNEALRILHKEISFTSIDTLELSRLLLPDLGRYKLNILAKELGAGSFEHHRASEDAAVLSRIFAKLLQKLKTEYHLQYISEIHNALADKKKSKKQLKNLKRYHLILLVKNQTGLRNLYRLISKSYLEYFNKRPIIPKSEILQYREGLMIGSACEAGEIFKAIVQHESWDSLLEKAKFYDYLEIQPTQNNAFLISKGIVPDTKALQELNQQILQLADATEIPCCATGDVHFLDATDEAFRRILMSGQGFPDADHQPPLYFKTTDEMLEEFSYLGKERAYEVVVTNTNRIADMCEHVRPVPRENYPPKIEGSAEELENRCRSKAKQIYGDPLPELVQKRLDRELGSIIGNGYDVMYIIAQKLVCKSLEDGYLVGSRGSVGSSLVAFLSDITEVNSLPPHYVCPACKYVEWHEELSCGVDLPDQFCPQCNHVLKKEGFSIPFETFLGFDGDKVPDIDLNFSGEYQPRIHAYTAELFGKDHVFRAGTLGTIATKTAYGFVKKYLDEHHLECSKAEINRLSAGCTGIKRTTGQHPGGIVVVPKEVEIYDFCPVQHPADDPNSDIITTHFEYHSIDANLLKLDELGHDDPTMIKHLEQLTGVNAQEIPLDDADTMSLFTSNEALRYIGETDAILGEMGCIAVPEFGTKFVRGMLKDTKPTTFADLVSISGLSHGTDVWLGNAQMLVQKGIPLSGCICCRDDIMNYLILQGVDPKLSFTIMEAVRKGKGLKPEWEKNLKTHQVPDWYIDSCNKIKYMFPKAHAVAYVMMAFRIAWFKVHYPLAFYAAYFSIRAKSFDANYMIQGDSICIQKINELSQKEKEEGITTAEKDMITTLEVCHEFYKRGFVFEKMDIYQSDSSSFLMTEKGLIPPLIAMPGVGEQAAKDIIQERNKGRFISSEDLVMRCAKVGKAVIEVLNNIGALEGLPSSTQMTLFE